jgi:peroxiredoxin
MKRVPVRNIWIVLFVFFLLQCGKKDYDFQVEGKFKVPVETKIILGNLGLEKIDIVDSAMTGKDGQFVLKGPCHEPSLFVMQYQKESIYLVIKPQDHLRIDIDNTLQKPSYYVNGSSDSRLVRELFFEQQKILDQITQISIDYEKSKQDPETFVQKKHLFDSLYDDLLAKHKKYTIQFIKKNPESLATIFALYQNFGKSNQPLFDKFNDIRIFNFVDSNLTIRYPNTPAVIALNRDVTEIKEQIDFKAYSENLIKPGRKMPDFNLTSINGQQLDLEADFPDKPVVLFFFGVWDKTCRDEAKSLNELYLRYRYLGLKIIGVSFDSSKENLGTFISKNEISFPIVCDYNYWNSDYVKQFGVRTVPSIILLNRNHIVENRDIKTNELKVTLEEWRKNKLF